MPPVAIVAGVITPGGARSGWVEAVVDAITDGGKAAQFAGGEGVDEVVADGLAVPGRGPDDLGVTGAGAGGRGAPSCCFHEPPEAEQLPSLHPEAERVPA
jgi:hypothetical protein